MTTTATYGTWRSPITAELLVEQVVIPTQVQTDGNDIYWNERRPGEGGRQVIVVHRASGEEEDLLPSPFSARSMVHEYGGQSFCVRDGILVFSNLADQRLYLRSPGGEILPLTDEAASGASVRYADQMISHDARFLVCVRERHGVEGRKGAGGVVNEIVRISLSGSHLVEVLASGNDFYLAPRLSPDDAELAYLTWNHPNMPWDGTELHTRSLAEGAREDRLLAGGPEESISQPRYGADGMLYYLSDRSGFWNIYDREGNACFPIEAECGGPDWVFGQSTYLPTQAGQLIVAYTRNAKNQIAIVHGAEVHEPTHALTNLSSLALTSSGALVALGASAGTPLGVISMDYSSGEITTIRSSRSLSIDPGYLSLPRHFAFPTSDGAQAYALYYAPKNIDFQGAPGERPPLIVQSHGGPTANARQLFDPEIQFWTSRGFALIDVDYGGSTGYGRAYRERLNGKWGVVDVEDCANAARYLIDRGRVDPRRIAIHGGSAGGYTTLACLTFTRVFEVGASYYGVSDPALLAEETHKFESRYLDRLIGPYPEMRDRYNERSPLHHSRELRSPVIFFQGLDDKIVPPNQAERLIDALHFTGIPTAYIAFPGEGHGFRGAEAITQSIEAELYFYSRVLDIEVADTLNPIPISDDSALAR